jgi:hypothetical protein
MSGQKQNSAKFVGKKARAISALLTSPTIEAASQVAHIPTSTLRRWRARPDFADALAAAQGEIFLATCNEFGNSGQTRRRRWLKFCEMKERRHHRECELRVWFCNCYCAAIKLKFSKPA